MPRLITLLLLLASLATLAVQNRSISLPLVILSSETPAIPVGLWLVGALCIGGLITLLLYGLLGLRRPVESKYRPMGRRVSGPDTPSSATPPSVPFGGVSGSVANPATAPSGTAFSSVSGGSTAFVSDSVTPQKTGSSPSLSPPTPSTPSPPIDDSLVDSPYRSSSDGSGEKSFASSASPQNKPRQEGSDSASRSAFTSRNEPFAQPRSTIDEASPQKKKAQRAGSRPEKEKTNRRIGDDWGDLRTPAHRNSWDLDERHPSQGGLFDFIPARTRESASRLASDIADGWNGRQSDQTSQYSRQSGYDSDYRSVDEDHRGSVGESDAGRYDDARYSELDEGWERFDPYNPPPSGLDAEKRVYTDSLYEESRYDDSAERFPDDGFLDDGFLDNNTSEVGPDGVYDADYRVIVPPSKPLPDDIDGYADDPNK